ncbi:MAG: hypothetical protein QXR48_01755 [Candidatus Woesearchaeota archaeon]
MHDKNRGLTREVQREIFRFVRSNSFERRTGIPGWAVAGIFHDSRNRASLLFTQIVLEERVKEWAKMLNRDYAGIHFSYEILDFESYCASFQSRLAGRSPETLPLFEYIRRNGTYIFGKGDIYEGVQFRASGLVVTEVDFVASGMLVKVDGPLRRTDNHSHHRKRKHNSLYKAQSFIDANGYPDHKLVRLEARLVSNEKWDICLYDIEGRRYLQRQMWNKL